MFPGRVFQKLQAFMSRVGVSSAAFAPRKASPFPWFQDVQRSKRRGAVAAATSVLSSLLLFCLVSNLGAATEQTNDGSTAAAFARSGPPAGPQRHRNPAATAAGTTATNAGNRIAINAASAPAEAAEAAAATILKITPTGWMYNGAEEYKGDVASGAEQKRPYEYGSSTKPARPNPEALAAVPSISPAEAYAREIPAGLRKTATTATKVYNTRFVLPSVAATVNYAEGPSGGAPPAAAASSVVAAPAAAGFVTPSLGNFAADTKHNLARLLALAHDRALGLLRATPVAATVAAAEKVLPKELLAAITKWWKNNLNYNSAMAATHAAGTAAAAVPRAAAFTTAVAPAVPVGVPPAAAPNSAKQSQSEAETGATRTDVSRLRSTAPQESYHGGEAVREPTSCCEQTTSVPDIQDAAGAAEKTRIHTPHRQAALPWASTVAESLVSTDDTSVSHDDDQGSSSSDDSGEASTEVAPRWQKGRRNQSTWEAWRDSGRNRLRLHRRNRSGRLTLKASVAGKPRDVTIILGTILSVIAFSIETMFRSSALHELDGIYSEAQKSAAAAHSVAASSGSASDGGEVILNDASSAAEDASSSEIAENLGASHTGKLCRRWWDKLSHVERVIMYVNALAIVQYLSTLNSSVNPLPEEVVRFKEGLEGRL